MARVLESLCAESDVVNGNSLFFSVVEGDCCGVVVVVDVGDENGGVVVDGDLHGVIVVWRLFAPHSRGFVGGLRLVLPLPLC